MLSKSSLQTPVRILHVSARVNEIAPQGFEKNLEPRTNFFKSGEPLFRANMRGNPQLIFIAAYPSTKGASRQLGLDSSSISKVCRGVQHTCGGFISKYKE